MSKPKRYSDREFKRVLKDNGFEPIRQSGDHIIYSNGKRKLTSKKNLNHMIALRLMKEYNLRDDRIDLYI